MSGAEDPCDCGGGPGGPGRRGPRGRDRKSGKGRLNKKGKGRPGKDKKLTEAEKAE